MNDYEYKILSVHNVNDMLKNGLIQYNGIIGEVIIPEGVEEIDDWALSAFEIINSVIFPKSLKKIKKFIFMAPSGVNIHFASSVDIDTEAINFELKPLTERSKNNYINIEFAKDVNISDSMLEYLSERSIGTITISGKTLEVIPKILNFNIRHIILDDRNVYTLDCNNFNRRQILNALRMLCFYLKEIILQNFNMNIKYILEFGEYTSLANSVLATGEDKYLNKIVKNVSDIPAVSHIDKTLNFDEYKYTKCVLTTCEDTTMNKTFSYNLGNKCLIKATGLKSIFDIPDDIKADEKFLINTFNITDKLVIDCQKGTVDKLINILNSLELCIRNNIKEIVFVNIDFNNIKEILKAFLELKIDNLKLHFQDKNNQCLSYEGFNLVDINYRNEYLAIPEGTVSTGNAYINNNNLKQIILPKSLYDVSYSLFHNKPNLESLKILGSKLFLLPDFINAEHVSKVIYNEVYIKNLYYNYNLNINSALPDAFLKFENLHVNCQDASIEELINGLKHILNVFPDIKKMYLYNIDRSFYFQIKRHFLFKNIKIMGNEDIFKLDEIKEFSFTNEDLFKLNKNKEYTFMSEDNEVNQKLQELNNLMLNLEDNEKTVLKNMVNKLLEDFKNNQANLKPKYNQEEINLSLDNQDIVISMQMLKLNLIKSLDSIINSIKHKAEYLNLLEEIKKYKSKLNSQEKLEHSDDLVEEIIRISKEKGLENIKTKLVTILDSTSKNVSNYLLNGLNNSESNLELANEDYLKIFDKEVLKLYTIANNKEIILNAFKGIGDNALAKDINTIYEIINLLNIEFQEEMKQKLNNILSNIEDEEYLKEYSEIELNIRKFLQDYLVELKEKGSNLTAIQNIIDDINNINKPNSNNTLIISGLINEIIKNCPLEIVEEVKGEIEEVINKWRTKITNKEYQLNNQEYGNLNEATNLTLHILKDLYAIKFKVDKQKTNLQTYNKSVINIR